MKTLKFSEKAQVIASDAMIALTLPALMVFVLMAISILSPDLSFSLKLLQTSIVLVGAIMVSKSVHESFEDSHFLKRNALLVVVALTALMTEVYSLVGVGEGVSSTQLVLVLVPAVVMLAIFCLKRRYDLLDLMRGQKSLEFSDVEFPIFVLAMVASYILTFMYHKTPFVLIPAFAGIGVLLMEIISKKISFGEVAPWLKDRRGEYRLFQSVAIAWWALLPMLGITSVMMQFWNEVILFGVTLKTITIVAHVLIGTLAVMYFAFRRIGKYVNESDRKREEADKKQTELRQKEVNAQQERRRKAVLKQDILEVKRRIRSTNNLTWRAILFIYNADKKDSFLKDLELPSVFSLVTVSELKKKVIWDDRYSAALTLINSQFSGSYNDERIKFLVSLVDNLRKELSAIESYEGVPRLIELTQICCMSIDEWKRAA